MNSLYIIEVLEQLVKKKFRVVGQVTIFHPNQGQPLGQGLSFVVQRENIDILRDIFLLTDQAHLRDKAGGQPLKADGYSYLRVGAGDISPGGHCR